MYSRRSYTRYIQLFLVCILFLYLPNAIAAVADSFRYPVGADNGKGWVGNTNGLEWLQQWNYGGKCGYVYHPGVDFNKDGTTGNGDLGQPVYAIANGVVTFSGAGGALWGDVILIEHTLPNGSKVWSQYGHVRNRSVSSGTTVSKGQQIAQVGNANGAWFAHLHFEIRKSNMSATAFPCGKAKSYVEANYYEPEDFIKARFNAEVQIKDFWVKEGEIFSNTTSGFDAQFKLKNASSSNINIPQVSLAIHKVDAAKTVVKNMKLFNNVSISAGTIWQTGVISTDTPAAGDYIVLAKIYRNNTWITLGEQKITIKNKIITGNCPASLGNFNPNVIIPENEVKFFEIPEAQIRAFLVNQGSVLSSLDMTLAKLGSSSYPFDPVENTKRSGKTASQFYTTVTNPLARWRLQELANNTPTNQYYDAAKLIYLTAKENNMNPVLLLAILEKEQRLIGSESMSYSSDQLRMKLNKATGYGVMSSGTNLLYHGFLAQIAGTSWDMNSKMSNGMSFVKWATDYATAANDESNLHNRYSVYRKYFMDLGYSPCSANITDKAPIFTSVTLPINVTVPNKMPFTGTLSDDKGLSILTMMVSGPKGNDILGFSNAISGKSVSLSSYYFDSNNSTYAGTPGAYTVTLWAKDNAGQAIEGTRFNVTVQGGNINAPSNLRVRFSGSSYTLAWNDNSSNEAGFKIEGSTDNKTWKEVSSLVSNVTQVSGSMAGLSPGTKVYFRVRAINGSTYSSYSNVLEFVVPSVKTPTSVNVTCPTSVNENSNASCSAVAFFSDGSTISNGFSWSENSSYASINNSSGVLSTSTVNSDQSVIVTASYTDNGTTKSGSKTVTIKKVVAIDGMKFVTDSPKDDTIYNGGDSFDKSWVLQNTGTSTWNSSYCLSPVAGGSSLGSSKTCVSGTVAPGASHTFIVKMKAPTAQATEMTHRQDWRLTNAAGVRVGTYDVYARIKVKGAVKTLSSVNVTCPASVNENSNASCSAVAFFSDGSTISNGFSWSENSSYASISSSGALSASSVSSDQSVSVTASYTHNGTTKSGSKTVTIKDVPPAYDGKDPISMGCDSDATTVASKTITGGAIELRYSKKCGTNWARTKANSSSSSTYAKVTRSSDGRSYSYSGKGSIYTAMVYSPTTVSCAEGKIGTASASGACR